MDEARLDELDYAYLTTTGRVSGEPREIEIWFALAGGTVYFLAGGGRRANWVRNIVADPRVSLRIGERTWPGTGRVVDDPAEDALARRALLAKYERRYGGDLGGWGRTALPVAVERAGG